MTPLPAGFRLVLDRSVRRYDAGRVLLGGRPLRAIRLSDAGRTALAQLLAGASSAPAPRRLARRLTDAGLAHPRPPAPPPELELTVVIPVRDRPRELARCLAAVGRHHRVVVVDDGSRDPRAIDAACAGRARVVRLVAPGGPAAARNAALSDVQSELLAFLDSDCVPEPGWLATLAAHLADPRVAAVAPRVRPLRGGTGGRPGLRAFLAACSPLDMGPHEALVTPTGAVPYVPTAALLVRRTALEEHAFDPELRHGEDVDLVWRLHDAGWRVRYEPDAVVRHAEPTDWRVALDRRRRYGTAAAGLARRHPGRLVHLVIAPWPAAVAALALGGRPRLAVALLSLHAARLTRRLRARGVPGRRAPGLCLQALGATLVGLGRAATMLAAPVLAGACVSRRTRRPALALLLGPPLAEWVRRRPEIDPLRWSLACVADDLAYGAGVWEGCLRARTLAPLVPRPMSRVDFAGLQSTRGKPPPEEP